MSLTHTPQQIEALVAQAQRGNSESFEVLYDIFFDRIWRYISFRAEAEVREDLVADVFLKVVQNLKKYKYKEGSAFAAWVYRIAHNTIVDHYRKQKEILGLENGEDQEDFFASIPDEKELKPDQKTQQYFEHQKLYEVLKQMTPLHREILELKFLEDFNNHEIAQITGKTEGNIRIIQLRALCEMRKHFNIDGVTED